ncbi:MAG: hypothetical protein V3S55_15955 [Nitrospiraceae bacterium]
MAITGTIPFFDISTSRLAAASAVLVTGASADGQADGTHSNETMQTFLLRGVQTLSVSGTQAIVDVSGTVNGQTITSGELSGIMNLQRELAMRAADLARPEAGNAARLAWAQTALTGAGAETQFGS